jgi:hypothetical protein
VAIKRTHVIENKVSFPAGPDQMILTGSLMYVGNPLFKCPDATGATEREIDLNLIPDNYLSRTHYSRVIDVQSYLRGIATLKWDPTQRHTDLYRIAFRFMLNLSMERTLIGALIPPGHAHVNAVQSVAFKDEQTLVFAYPMWISLPFDFLAKTMSRTNFFESTFRSFPWASMSSTAQHRALRLACLTSHYADLWNRNAADLHVLPWSSEDPRLDVESTHTGEHMVQWNRKVSLRSDFARRLALLEIDVLVAQALGLTLNQLIEMYRTQFHVLDENERATWYDMKGRIVWTCSKGLTGGWLQKGRRQETLRKGMERAICRDGGRQDA